MHCHHEKRDRLLRHRHAIVGDTDSIDTLDKITAEKGLQSTRHVKKEIF